MLRLHALAYVCDPTPISAFLFPLLSGVQLKITANFCKWRWRRLKCCMHCMRRHGEGCVSVYVRVQDNDVLTLPRPRPTPPHHHPLTHTHSSRGIMMVVGIVVAQIFVDNGCENWRRVIAFAPCQPPNSTHKAEQKGLQNFCLSPWPGFLEV